MKSSESHVTLTFTRFSVESHLILTFQTCVKGSPSTLEHGLTVLVELVRHATSASRASDGASSPVVVQVLQRMGDLVEVRLLFLLL
jgi:hypothetical protein